MQEESAYYKEKCGVIRDVRNVAYEWILQRNIEMRSLFCFINFIEYFT